MDRIRFYSDEHVPKAVTRGLRQRGVDVLTAREAGLLGAADDAHLARAVAESRVIITQDDDFLRLASAGFDHAGIVYARQGIPVRAFLAGLMLVYEVLAPDEMRNHVEFV